MSDFAKPSEAEAQKLNEYERVLLDLQSEDSWNREYAQKRIEDYHFKRPTNTWVGRLLVQSLGQMPERFVMQMDKIKSNSTMTNLSAMLLMIAMFAVTFVLLMWVPPSRITSLFAVLLMPISQAPALLAIAALVAVVGVIWLARRRVADIYKFDSTYWTRSVVEGSDYFERGSAVQTMIFRTGAESWTTKQKVISVALSILMAGPLFVIWLPLAFVPSIVVAYSFFMYHYLKSWKKHRNTMLASIENARLVASFKRMIVFYFAVCLSTWLLVVDFWPNFGEVLVKIGQALQG